MVYLLFAGDSYYANGGAADLKGSYPSEDAARAALVIMDQKWENDWAHILDLDTMTVTVLRQGYYCGQVNDDPDNCFSVRPA